MKKAFIIAVLCLLSMSLISCGEKTDTADSKSTGKAVDVVDKDVKTKDKKEEKDKEEQKEDEKYQDDSDKKFSNLGSIFSEHEEIYLRANTSMKVNMSEDKIEYTENANNLYNFFKKDNKIKVEYLINYGDSMYEPEKAVEIDGKKYEVLNSQLFDFDKKEYYEWSEYSAMKHPIESVKSSDVLNQLDTFSITSWEEVIFDILKTNGESTQLDGREVIHADGFLDPLKTTHLEIWFDKKLNYPIKYIVETSVDPKTKAGRTQMSFELKIQEDLNGYDDKFELPKDMKFEE